MIQKTIYEVRIIYIGQLNDLRKRDPFVAYFSNLKNTIHAVQTNLAANRWDLKKVNYSAVYRTFKIRDKFVCDFDVKGLRVFQIVISKKTLNPALTNLGIDEYPL